MSSGTSSFDNALNHSPRSRHRRSRTPVPRLVTCALLMLPVFFSPAGADGFIIRGTVSNDPWIPALDGAAQADRPRVRFEHRCYDRFGGDNIPCEMTFEFRGLRTPLDSSTGGGDAALNSGGHQHDFETHPMRFIAEDVEVARLNDMEIDNIVRDGEPVTVITGTTPLTVDGEDRHAMVSLPMPEAAGRVEVDVELRTPFRFNGSSWFCASRCFDERTHKYNYNAQAAVRGLVEIPDSDLYDKVRSPEPEHPNGFNVQPGIPVALVALARRVQRKTGRKLSFNDGSLITGGIFDFDNSFVNAGGESVPWEPWTPPHKTHRRGLDLDLNQAGDISCQIQANGELDPVFKIFRDRLPLFRGKVNSMVHCCANPAGDVTSISPPTSSCRAARRRVRNERDAHDRQ